MQNNQATIELLYNKWISKQASAEEVEQLFRLLETSDINVTLSPLMKEHWEKLKDVIHYTADEQDRAVQGILNKYPIIKDEVSTPVHRVHFLPSLLLPMSKLRRARKTAWFRYPTSVKLRWASAAAIIIAFGIIGYLWNTKEKESAGIAQSDTISINNDVLPGSEKAILTLSNGEQVELNASTVKTINDGRLVINNQKGSLTYGKTNEIGYNTMTTPKGGQYKVVLPDGTRAWLNAASSITYPIAFSQKTREVRITGEVYFEVAKDRLRPFYVRMRDMEVQVLGTHFNINSYKDEPSIKTTLLEGSIKVSAANGENILLKPGEQAQQLTVLRSVDISQVMALEKTGYSILISFPYRKCYVRYRVGMMWKLSTREI